MITIALFCHDHRSFRTIVDYYCMRKYKLKEDRVASPVLIRPDGTEVKIVYIKGERNIQGIQFDKICIEDGITWTEDHRYNLEVIAARSGKSYSDLYKYATRVPHPHSKEFIAKKRLKVFKEIGT